MNLNLTYSLAEDSGVPGNHVLDGGADHPWQGAILGKEEPIVKGLSVFSCATTAERVDFPVGLWTRVG